MKTLVTLFLILIHPLVGSSQSNVDHCLTCHEILGDKPSKLFKHDVHFEKGVTCAGCHGGDRSAEEMEQAMAVAKDYIGVPKGDDISRTCVKCHSNAAVMVKEFNSPLPRNQGEILSASVHGKLSVTGKERIAQCTNCHNAHGIVSVKDPSSPVYPLNVPKTCAKCHSDAAFMRSYDPAMAVDQLEKYRTSVHGVRNARGDVKVAACAHCHGSHDIRSAHDLNSTVYATNLPSTCGTCHSNAKYMQGYKIPTDQVKKFMGSVHGKALLEKHDLGAPSCNSCHGNHGAVPPQVESISQVCGTCHAMNATLFASSPHKKAFASRRLPECETCHGYHDIVRATDELLGVSPGAACSRCHDENEKVKGYVTARNMRKLIDSLEWNENHAAALVDDAEQKGMEISEAKFKLRDVHQAWLQSRTMVHAFNEEKFREVISKGLDVTSSVVTDGQQAIDEYYFRRWGLGIASFIITIVAASLYLTIRQIEKKQQQEKKP